jgi:arginine decarboxylase
VKPEVRAPLLSAYLDYLASDNLPFTIPGHKQKTNQIDLLLGQIVDRDIPLYGGLDEIKLSKGVLLESEKLAADFWGAALARFSTGGSTHCNQAIALAIAQPGKKIAISRTSHRSLLSAIVLAGLEPIWMVPEIDETTGFPIGISEASIKAALQENPIAIFLTDPGYLGTVSNLSKIVEIAHKENVPVIIDAAWGAHFGFHPELPQHALQQGADALVTSIHKTLPGYSASALLLVQGKYIDLNRVNQAFETTHTTSPAGAPLASIDGVRSLLAREGEQLLGRLIENTRWFRNEVESGIGRKAFLEPNDFPHKRFDPVKLVMSASSLGIDGVAVERELIQSGIRVEMADRDTIVFLATIADSRVDFEILASRLIPILNAKVGNARQIATSISWSIKPERKISMRDAYFSKTEEVSFEDAVGRISADLIAPYPPGVAVVAPGELLTSEIVTGLRATKASGVRIAYATDTTLNTFRVTSRG